MASATSGIAEATSQSERSVHSGCTTGTHTVVAAAMEALIAYRDCSYRVAYNRWLWDAHDLPRVAPDGRLPSPTPHPATPSPWQRP